MGCGKLEKGDLVTRRSIDRKSAGLVSNRLASPWTVRSRRIAVAEANAETLVRPAKRGRIAAHESRAPGPVK